MQRIASAHDFADMAKEIASPSSDKERGATLAPKKPTNNNSSTLSAAHPFDESINLQQIAFGSNFGAQITQHSYQKLGHVSWQYLEGLTSSRIAQRHTKLYLSGQERDNLNRSCGV